MLEDGTVPRGIRCHHLLLRRRHAVLARSEADRARVLQWMFFEQYNHEPTIAVVRHWVAILGKTPANEPLAAGQDRRPATAPST